jgi:hypothetical protein
MVSCDKNEIQRTGDQPDSTIPVTNRSIEDCEDCPQDPIEHCCCVIELLDLESGSTANFSFCGVYTGMAGSTCGSYSPPSPCSTIPFGLSSSFSMDLTTNSRKYFCLADGASFRVENIGSGGASIRISCRADQLNPGWQYINLDQYDFFYFAGGNDCFLSGCN